MVTNENGTGFFDSIIIHPGETLLEAMHDRGVSQSELARRTGVSEKHVSSVVSGKAGISATFAMGLEYALGIEASFWINLQANYDKELVLAKAFEPSAEELELLRGIPETVDYLRSIEIIPRASSEACDVFALRRLLKVANLSLAEACLDGVAYRAAKPKGSSCAILAWRRICERMVEVSPPPVAFDRKALEERIPLLRATMHLGTPRLQDALTAILREAGVSFQVLPALDGVSVLGMAELLPSGYALVGVATRHESPAEFWLTLFHELAHVLAGDERSESLCYGGHQALKELRATKAADDMVIDRASFAAFVKGACFDDASVGSFAASNGIPAFMVEERLARLGRMEVRNRERYEWTVSPFSTD